MIIDGKKIAEEILGKLKEERKKYEDLKIAAFLIGKDESKISFLKIKEKFAKELEIDFRIYEIDESWGKRKIRKYISQILRHKTIQGAIFQLPLPSHLPAQYLLNSIPAKKDIDCLTSRLLGKFFTNSPLVLPPAVEVVREIFERNRVTVDDKTILIIGYGKLVGKPVAHYLANQKATVIIAQENTDLRKFLLNADIVISGVGKAGLVNVCKEEAILIDFGYSFENGKIYGDIDFEKTKNIASLITPTPGGTGPILVAKLFENFLKLLEKKWIVI
ncbi:MAG: bifunctional 5,10-methylenetetrahydrofolate dehydrogenase/5,10-methenyltetrahydrofolate cyclohydrolase [Patescibacteria group bacterium]|nr:bifunctional 5,10-methylenetetrahydrofolate dehydrogenase/5,10-methenyltetrahydrofolate cyclohydrolase [Patescibacteria group bacterium]